LVKLMMDLGLRPALALRDSPAVQINVCSLTNVTTIMVPSASRQNCPREQESRHHRIACNAGVI